jgi:hypothetical protein
MKIFFLSVILLFASAASAFQKVVLWGHKLHSHTHSYIHAAFFRAFQDMGYPVYWFDNSDDVRNMDFAYSLFITEGQVDEQIPILDNCEYILHNCDSSKYRPFFEKKQAIKLQVYTDDVLNWSTCKKIAPCIYYDVKGQCIYMPWATDLLPQEIDAVKQSLPKVKKNKTIQWIGSMGGGEFGNIEQLSPFIKAAETIGVGFECKGGVSFKDNLQRVSSAYMAPAIVGGWQQRKGYIPCRIFKNISYGQMGITNSPRIYELFEGKVVYNPDTYQLFFDAKKALEEFSQENLYELMDFVRDNHTYLNRIRSLLDFFELTKNDN